MGFDTTTDEVLLAGPKVQFGGTLNCTSAIVGHDATGAADPPTIRDWAAAIAPPSASIDDAAITITIRTRTSNPFVKQHLGYRRFAVPPTVEDLDSPICAPGAHAFADAHITVELQVHVWRVPGTPTGGA